MKEKLHPVILCGGAGSRLWPLSRRMLPKQFLPLPGAGRWLKRTVEYFRETYL